MCDNIGKTIVKKRKQMGYTQQKIADCLNVSFQAVSKWENGTAYPDIMKIKPPVKPYRVLEIGCGEGKDAVFLAKNGYLVTAFDAPETGLNKARRLAEQHGCRLTFFRRMCWITGRILPLTLYFPAVYFTIFWRNLERK